MIRSSLRVEKSILWFNDFSLFAATISHCLDLSLSFSCSSVMTTSLLTSCCQVHRLLVLEYQAFFIGPKSPFCHIVPFDPIKNEKTNLTPIKSEKTNLTPVKKEKTEARKYKSWFWVELSSLTSYSS